MQRICSATVFVFAACITSVSAQQKTEKQADLAQLELTAEIAATTDDGIPTALRITIKNVGNVTVDMPVIGDSCHPSGGISVESFWLSKADGTGMGSGHGCGITDLPPLMQRVKEDWNRLRPGEFVVTTENLRPIFHDLKPGTVEYWVEYIPPDATKEEILALQQEGYVIPTEKLATPHMSFDIL